MSDENKIIKELRSLFNLLDEPDIELQNNIAKKIISIYEETFFIDKKKNTYNNLISLLEEEISLTLDNTKKKNIKNINSTIKKYLKNIYSTIKINNYTNSIIEWQKNEITNLYKGYLIFSSFKRHINKKDVDSLINSLVRDIWLELNNYSTPIDKIITINKVLFNTHKYKIENNNTDEKLIFLDEILKNKKTTEISFKIFTLTIFQLLHLPIKPILINKTLWACYTNNYRDIPFINDNTILFFFNPIDPKELINTTNMQAPYEIINNYNIILLLINELCNILSQKNYPIHEINTILKRL